MIGGDLEIRNRVLLSLRPAAQDFLSRRLITSHTFAGQIIYEDGAPFTHAVFPHDGVLSLMANMESGRSVEKASIGPEGFLGFVLIMGGSRAVSTSTVQVPGYASWLALTDLHEALAQFECVRQAMLRYAAALITQLMESVACNSLHSAEQRVSRWLLQASDRVAGDSFQLTQQALSEVLGLRRATVSDVCSELQVAGILEYSRGTVTVSDRRSLEHRACECYARIHRAWLY
jgi:CRP-like cAMP-binding protein